MSAGILQFSQPIYKITESGEWLTEQVQVLRKNGATGNVSVKVTAKTESATVGKDIEKISQVLTWTDGDATPKFVNIKPIQDMYTEGDEFLRLSLSSIKGAKYAPVKTAQLVIYDRALPVTVLQASAINDSHIISIYHPVPGNNTGVKLGDFKNWLYQEIMASLPTPNPAPNPGPNPGPITPIPSSLDKSYQLNMATMLANGLSILANNVTTEIDSLGEHLSFSKYSSSLTIKGIEEKFNSDFAIEIKIAIDPQYSNIMGVEPDGFLNLRPDGSDWCFDVGVGKNNVITIPNSVSGINSPDTIRIIRTNNVVTLDVNGVSASKPVTQTYNTTDGLVIGNFNGFDGKLYGLKIFTSTLIPAINDPAVLLCLTTGDNDIVETSQYNRAFNNVNIDGSGRLVTVGNYNFANNQPTTTIIHPVKTNSLIFDGCAQIEFVGEYLNIGNSNYKISFDYYPLGNSILYSFGNNDCNLMNYQGHLNFNVDGFDKMYSNAAPLVNNNWHSVEVSRIAEMHSFKVNGVEIGNYQTDFNYTKNKLVIGGNGNINYQLYGNLQNFQLILL